MSDLQVKFHVEDGNLTVQATQDCTPIVERAKSLHNEGMHGLKDFKHAMELPNVIVEAYLNQHKITYEEFLKNKEHLKRVLNSPDLAYFRIWKGRV